MTVLGVLLTIAGGQTERWVYRYNGLGNGDVLAWSLVAGADGNIYPAGGSTGSGDPQGFTVISLTSSGTERWVYRYNGSGNSFDCAYSVVAGTDGNIYAAGRTAENDTNMEFTVISLTSSGTERWVYRYGNPAGYNDGAYSLFYGAHGNIYAAGWSYGSGTGCDFMVVSLTTSGTERWVYRYNGPGNRGDCAYSVVAGTDGNIYAAGYRTGSGGHQEFTVISLTTSGTERWVYCCDGPWNEWDEANSIVAGADGNIYAAGWTWRSGTGCDFTVVSLTSLGAERWVYRYGDPVGYADDARSLVYGADGNIYAAGYSMDAEYRDFAVISLTSLGAERWVYRYNAPGGTSEAHSIVTGADGNIYAAGYSRGGTGPDFTVISLTSSGRERWVYRYTGPGIGDDCARSIVVGADGNIYAAGYCVGSGTGYDFTVISLTSVTGIAEAGPSTRDKAFGLAAGTVQNRALAYTLKLPEHATVSLSLCDLQGRKLASWQVPAPKGTSQHTRNLPDLSPGVYFLNAEEGTRCGIVSPTHLRFGASRKLIAVKRGN
jgi:uncharacterized delta-60 repeat protein